jgi:hypothetical protein
MDVPATVNVIVVWFRMSEMPLWGICLCGVCFARKYFPTGSLHPALTTTDDEDDDEEETLTSGA